MKKEHKQITRYNLKIEREAFEREIWQQVYPVSKIATIELDILTIHKYVVKWPDNKEGLLEIIEDFENHKGITTLKAQPEND